MLFESIFKFCKYLSNNIETNEAVINFIVALSIWKKVITETKCDTSFDCEKRIKLAHVFLLSNDILFANS